MIREDCGSRVRTTMSARHCTRHVTPDICVLSNGTHPAMRFRAAASLLLYRSTGGRAKFRLDLLSPDANKLRFRTCVARSCSLPCTRTSTHTNQKPINCKARRNDHRFGGRRIKRGKRCEWPPGLVLATEKLALSENPSTRIAKVV